MVALAVADVWLVYIFTVYALPTLDSVMSMCVNLFKNPAWIAACNAFKTQLLLVVHAAAAAAVVLLGPLMKPTATFKTMLFRMEVACGCGMRR